MVLCKKPGLVRQQGEAKRGECESKGVNLLQPKQACVHKKGAEKPAIGGVRRSSLSAEG